MDIRHRDLDYGAVATVWRSFEIEYFSELPETVDLLVVTRLDACAEDFERQNPFDLAIVDEDGNSIGTFQETLEVPKGQPEMRSAWNMTKAQRVRNSPGRRVRPNPQHRWRP